MSNPLVLELIRQALRWLGVWLMTTGILPPQLAELVDDPQTVAFVSGLVSYTIAEAGWIVAKIRSFWARLRADPDTSERAAALRREPDRDFRTQPLPSAPTTPPPPKPKR